LGSDFSSGRNSEYVVEGTRLDSKDLTGYGATGTSIREDADGLYLIDPTG
jgi:hypothetical protein